MRSLSCLVVVLLVVQAWAQSAVDTRIPSESRRAQGIFIRITVPASARYGPPVRPWSSMFRVVLLREAFLSRRPPGRYRAV
ncbi:MAG: hypothetical protein QHJ34_01695 [bacterium]|jgi:hypothetical protein|nr:hypothetical protein [candidate division KSB1 bacterium]MDH7558932.1 hypothetical protein [bacterium]